MQLFYHLCLFAYHAFHNYFQASQICFILSRWLHRHQNDPAVDQFLLQDVVLWSSILLGDLGVPGGKSCLLLEGFSIVFFSRLGVLFNFEFFWKDDVLCNIERISFCLILHLSNLCFYILIGLKYSYNKNMMISLKILCSGAHICSIWAIKYMYIITLKHAKIKLMISFTDLWKWLPQV